MRVLALAIRILRQIIRDKRTMGLLIFAPILVMTMLHLVFDGDEYIPKVGLVDIPNSIMDKFDTTDARITAYLIEDEAKIDLSAQKIDGYLVFNDHSPEIFLEGSDPSVNSAVIHWIQTALATLGDNEEAGDSNIHFLHGSSSMGQFDYFGPVLLGFFVFFFVFLIAGVSFIRGRTTGTLERLLSTPIRKWEIVLGYVFGFGIFTMFKQQLLRLMPFMY